MNLEEKRRILKHLLKLKRLNQKNLFIYKLSLETEKRMAINRIYRQLYLQKKEFLEDISKMISRIEKEIRLLTDELTEKKPSDHRSLRQLELKYKCGRSFLKAYELEMKSMKKYKKRLSKVNYACVREMIMTHHHQIKHNISEMSRTGLLKYAI